MKLPTVKLWVELLITPLLSRLEQFQIQCFLHKQCMKMHTTLLQFSSLTTIKTGIGDYERARSARSFFFNLGEKSEYERRAAGRPVVVTLLIGLYLSNHETVWLDVFVLDSPIPPTKYVTYADMSTWTLLHEARADWGGVENNPLGITQYRLDRSCQNLVRT